MAGGDDVALGGVSAVAEGDDVIHGHLIGKQRCVAVEAVCCGEFMCPPARAPQLFGFGFLALDVCLWIYFNPVQHD